MRRIILNFWVCGTFLLLIPSFVTGEDLPLDSPQNFLVNPKHIALHHPVKTDQNLAQLYFDQGLSFVYAFNQDAAYWSFKKAAQIDPNMAMAYWGMALALGPNLNVSISKEFSKQVYDLIQIGKQKAVNSPQVEKDYLEALARRFSDNSEKNEQDVGLDYSLAMLQLHQKYLDDPDAAVLYAASILEKDPRNQWKRDGSPIGNTLEAVNVLQSVLRKYPDHTGANHYYIHAVEDSAYPDMALMSADRLSKLQQSSGHMLHMSSHIYLLVGNYIQAIASNLDAIAADRAYIREYGMDGVYPASYLSHNLYYLSRAYTMAGRLEDAMQTAKALEDLYVSTFPFLENDQYYASTPLSVLITFNRWNDILNLKSPDDGMKLPKTLWFFGRALAYANLANNIEAEREFSLFLEHRKKEHSNVSFSFNRKNQILDIAQYSLESKMAENRGEMDVAIGFLNQAIGIQNSLRVSEPPNWFYPARISLGILLLKVNKAQEAEVIFREELKSAPCSGRALFGLLESLKAQSKNSDAYWVNEEFQRAWGYSTITLNDIDFKGVK